MPFEFGTTPADSETLESWKEIELSDDSYDDIYWSTRLMIEIIPEGYSNVVSNGECTWESKESDIFVFANRSEAIRFKKLFIEAIEGKNTWGKNQWCLEGIKSEFDRFFRSKDTDSIFTKEDIPKIANSIKTGLNINKLYRN
jgi:hypothetical protein